MLLYCNSWIQTCARTDSIIGTAKRCPAKFAYRGKNCVTLPIRPAGRPHVEKWSSQTRLEIECKFRFLCKFKQGWEMSVNYSFLASFLQRAKDLKIQCFCKGARRKKRLGAGSNLRPPNLKGWSLPIELCHELLPAKPSEIGRHSLYFAVPFFSPQAKKCIYLRIRSFCFCLQDVIARCTTSRKR